MTPLSDQTDASLSFLSLKWTNDDQSFFSLNFNITDASTLKAVEFYELLPFLLFSLFTIP